MSSPKAPKSPITFLNTTKTNSDKSNKFISSSSSKNNSNSTLSKLGIEAPTFHQLQQNKKQESPKNKIETQRNIENAHSSFISCQSKEDIKDNDSLESLKQKIDQLTDFSSQQAEIINSFQKNLDRLEISSKNYNNDSNVSQNTDPFLNIQYRFQFFIDNYINQKIKFDKLLENIQQKNTSELSQKAYEIDEFIQEKLGSNYTIIQLKEIFEQYSKSDQFIQENDTLKEKLKKAEKKLQEFKNEEDNKILHMVKSFYLNRKIDTNFSQHIEKDINLSMKVRCIFNDNENDEAILRTIQSNKESADDNKIIECFSANLQKLHKMALSENKKHQEELYEKDAQIDQKIKEIEDLNGQIEAQKNTIQILNTTIEKNEQELIEKEEEITSLKQEFEDRIHNLKDETQTSTKEREITSLKQESDGQVIKHKDDEKEREITSLKQESDSQVIKHKDDEKEREITSLKQGFEDKIHNLKDETQTSTKDREITSLKQESDSQVIKHKDDEKEREITSHKKESEDKIHKLKEEAQTNAKEIETTPHEQDFEDVINNHSEEEITLLNKKSDEQIFKHDDEKDREISSINQDSEYKVHNFEESETTSLKQEIEDKVYKLKDETQTNIKEREIASNNQDSYEQVNKLKNDEISSLKQDSEYKIHNLKEENQTNTKEREITLHKQESYEQNNQLKEDEIASLKQEFEDKINKLKEEIQAYKNKEAKEREIEISKIKQNYETKLNELKTSLLNKENLFDEVKYKLSEQQKLNDQKEKENIKLRLFVNNVKTILKVNKSTI